MARQYTQPKRPRNAAWYKGKAILAEAQEAGQVLDEEQLTFLVDPGIPDGQVVQTIIPNNAAFQIEDLDTYILTMRVPGGIEGKVTWGVGESGIALFWYGEGAQEWCRERRVSSEKGRENLLGLLGQGVNVWGNYRTGPSGLI
nr:hypothetical protein [Tanacetum cinerariifolium]